MATPDRSTGEDEREGRWWVRYVVIAAGLIILGWGTWRAYIDEQSVLLLIIGAVVVGLGLWDVSEAVFDLEKHSVALKTRERVIRQKLREAEVSARTLAKDERVPDDVRGDASAIQTAVEAALQELVPTKEPSTYVPQWALPDLFFIEIADTGGVEMRFRLHASGQARGVQAVRCALSISDDTAVSAIKIVDWSIGTEHVADFRYPSDFLEPIPGEEPGTLPEPTQARFWVRTPTGTDVFVASLPVGPRPF
jgi:hypothetical protein